MKDKIIEILRSVPISRTYPEYIEAIADKLIAEGVINLNNKLTERSGFTSQKGKRKDGKIQ